MWVDLSQSATQVVNFSFLARGTPVFHYDYFEKINGMHFPEDMYDCFLLITRIALPVMETGLRGMLKSHVLKEYIFWQFGCSQAVLLYQSVQTRQTGDG